MVKNLPANVGDARERSSIPASGRSPGVGNGNPLLYSFLENSIDRGAWWAPVRGAAKSWTRLSDWVHAPWGVYSDPYQRSLSRNHLVAKNRNPFKVTRGWGAGMGYIGRNQGYQKARFISLHEWGEKGESWEVENPRVFLHCVATSLSSLLYVPLCVLAPLLWLSPSVSCSAFCMQGRQCLHQPDFSRTVQASSTIAQHRLSKDGERRLPKMENGDSASFVSRLSSGPITRSGEGSRTM